MKRPLMISALVVLLAGCQPSWNNAYAPFGPATIPPVGAPAPQPGYYPTSAQANGSGSSQDATRTSTETRDGLVWQTPAGTRTPESVASIRQPSADYQVRPSLEAPIRIVEASPQSASPSASLSASSPTAHSSAPIEMSKLPRAGGTIQSTPAVNRAPALVPGTKASSSSRADFPVARASYEAPAAIFVETPLPPATVSSATEANGAWKSR